MKNSPKDPLGILTQAPSTDAAANAVQIILEKKIIREEFDPGSD